MPLKQKHQPTQNFVPIKEIRDGVVILEDRSFRRILMVSSINIALKSEEERAAILMQFQSFLNTLDFSVQIFIQSRELNITPYIQLLEDQYKKQDNDLLKIQTSEYIDFIKDYTENVNIMSKTFFVVIPYFPSIISSKKGGLFSKKTTEEKTPQKSFEEYRTQIEQRVTIVEQGLRRTGLRTVSLEDAEIRELFYNLFNPGEERSSVIL
jgi:type IV secretory pathway VirB4 component